jgi:hypothetical protein
MTYMTPEQAYLAMFSFLEEHWRRGGSDELAMLLSSMSLLPDGKPPMRPSLKTGAMRLVARPQVKSTRY